MNCVQLTIHALLHSPKTVHDPINDTLNFDVIIIIVVVGVVVVVVAILIIIIISLHL